MYRLLKYPGSLFLVLFLVASCRNGEKNFVPPTGQYELDYYIQAIKGYAPYITPEECHALRDKPGVEKEQTSSHILNCKNTFFVALVITGKIIVNALDEMVFMRLHP